MFKLRFLRPRWAKVLADLWDNKLRTLLVVASIAVGVFSVGAITNAYAILSEDINLSYASEHPANIRTLAEPFDDDFLQSVEGLPGVMDAEGRTALGVRASLDGESWLSLDLLAKKDYAASDIGLFTPIDGATIPGDRELLIRYDFMNDTGFEVGDMLQVQLPDGTIRYMPVVGMVGDQTTELAEPMAQYGGYVTMETLEWLGQPEYYNRLYARVSENADDEDHIQAVADTIEDKFERSGLQAYRTQVSKTNEFPMIDMLLAILGVMGALGVLVMLLSSSLIVNTLNALLAQHMRQIGVMKLIGARSFQVLGMYLALILIFGLIALLIAVPLGALAGYGLAGFIGSFVNANLQDFRFIPATIVLQVLIAVFVPLAAGFFPVRSGSKTSVRRAISSDGPGDQPTSSGWLSSLGERARWISRPVLLSIRNTFRRKGRLMLTLFTLTMAGAIFIAVFNVRASMEQFMDQLGQHFMADITLDFEMPYRFSKVADVAFQVPGVSDIEAWSGASAEILDQGDNLVENMQIIAPPADSALIEPDMVAGRWIMPGEGNALAVSDSIWNTYPDLQPGDTLRLSVAGGRVADWTVVGVFRFTNFLGDPLAYADYDHISDLMNMSGQAYSYRVVSEAHTLEDQQGISNALDKSLRAEGFQVGNIEAGLVTKEQTSQMINILVVFLLTMALLTAFVGSIGLMGTMGMNVLERTREIGVMRAIGAVDLKVVYSVIVEGLLIGLISWLLAVVSSYPISYLLLKIISEAMIDAPLPLAFTLQGTFIWLVVVLGLSVLASVLPARNAARLTIREVLAYE